MGTRSVALRREGGLTLPEMLVAGAIIAAAVLFGFWSQTQAINKPHEDSAIQDRLVDLTSSVATDLKVAATDQAVYNAMITADRTWTVTVPINGTPTTVTMHVYPSQGGVAVSAQTATAQAVMPVPLNSPLPAPGTVAN